MPDLRFPKPYKAAAIDGFSEDRDLAIRRNGKDIPFPPVGRIPHSLVYFAGKFGRYMQKSRRKGAIDAW